LNVERDENMLTRGIVLLLLAAMLAGQALGDGGVTVVPASQDVYVSMGGSRVSVYNQTDYLLCAVDVSEENGTEIVSYPGEPVIQFDISDVNISEEDVAVLVLKAEAMQASEDPVAVAMTAIGSDWDEASDYTTFLVNILPARNKLIRNDYTILSGNTDGDLIFAFDVSRKLLDARDEGTISFLLQAASNSSSEITFLSRESGQGPALLIMPYPATCEGLAAEAAETAEDTGSADIVTENLSAPEGWQELQNISASGGSAPPLAFQRLLPEAPFRLSVNLNETGGSAGAAAGPQITAGGEEAVMELMM